VGSEEKRADRRYTAGVAVFSAVFAVLGTLLVTTLQIDAQRDADRAQFLRNERRSAYGELVALDHKLRLAEVAAVRSTIRPDALELQEAGDQVVHIYDLLQEFVGREATVQLIGSRKAQEAATELFEAHREHYVFVQEVVDAWHSGDAKDELKRLAVTEERLVEAQGRFFTVARAELGQAD